MNLKPPAPALMRWTVGSLEGVGCDDAVDDEDEAEAEAEEASTLDEV